MTGGRRLGHLRLDNLLLDLDEVASVIADEASSCLRVCLKGNPTVTVMRYASLPRLRDHYELLCRKMAGEPGSAG